jgi:hypothetical protein
LDGCGSLGFVGVLRLRLAHGTAPAFAQDDSFVGGYGPGAAFVSFSAFSAFSLQSFVYFSLVGELFVDEAPAPVLAGFLGGHDGVLGGVEVLGRVLVGAGVAAAYVAAGEAGAEVDPLGVGLHALFAAGGVGVVGLGGGEMFAEGRHVALDATWWRRIAILFFGGVPGWLLTMLVRA